MSADSISNPYEGTNFLHIQDPHEEDLPSSKFGVGVFVGVWLAVILFSGLVVVGIIACSRMQEKMASNRSEDKKKQTQKDLKSNLTCKPWCPESPEMADSITSATERLESSSSDSGSEPSSNGESDMEDIELQAIPVEGNDMECQQGPSTQPHNKDGSCCAICSNEFQPGQPVYQSNNPQCSHVFHKVCLDKWLDFQNTCPVCNQPYVLQTV